MTATTLYGIAHSHPVLGTRLLLEAAGVEHRVRNLLPGLHGARVRLAGFPRWNVPALVLDGERIQGTMAIARALDARAPDAGIFPRDPEERRAVEEAERWGHDGPQAVARRVFRWAGLHDNAVRAWMAREVVGIPGAAAPAAGMAFTPAMAFFAWRSDAVADDAVRADLAGLPALLDHADGLVAAGTIGGARVNAADAQILVSLRLLMAHEDLHGLIAPRDCGRAAVTLLPEYPRPAPDAMAPVPAVLPAGWIPAA